MGQIVGSKYINQAMKEFYEEKNIEGVPDEWGFYPSARRIMSTMIKNHPTQIIKTGSLVTDSEQLHPHGDASINDTVYSLSQEWKMTVPLLRIHGSNGGTNIPAPANRYTEVSMQTPLLQKIVKYSKYVPMVTEETGNDAMLYIPTPYPYFLVSGQIATVGIGSWVRMPNHDYNQVLDAVIDNYEGRPIHLTPHWHLHNQVEVIDDYITKTKKTPAGQGHIVVSPTYKQLNHMECKAKGIKLPRNCEAYEVDGMFNTIGWAKIFNNIVKTDKDNGHKFYVDLKDQTKGYDSSFVFIVRPSELIKDYSSPIEKIFKNFNLTKHYNVAMAYQKNGRIYRTTAQEALTKWTNQRIGLLKMELQEHMDKYIKDNAQLNVMIKYRSTPNIQTMSFSQLLDKGWTEDEIDTFKETKIGSILELDKAKTRISKNNVKIKEIKDKMADEEGILKDDIEDTRKLIKEHLHILHDQDSIDEE